MLLALLLLMGLPDRFIYYPMRYPEGDWGIQAAVGAQDRWMEASDGTRLHGWWFPLPGAHFATLFLHGNAGNVTHRAAHAMALRQAGSAALVIDYRGYGRSSGSPGEKGLYLDAAAGYAELQRLGYTPAQIVVHGESLGTAVAAETALQHACAGLVLESAFASLSRMAAGVVPVLGPLFARGFDTESKIGRIHVPLLMIHGDRDEIVPFSQGQAVFARANEPKQFWSVPGGTHNTLLEAAGTAYADRLRSFYASLAK